MTTQTISRILYASSLAILLIEAVLAKSSDNLALVIILIVPFYVVLYKTVGYESRKALKQYSVTTLRIVLAVFILAYTLGTVDTVRNCALYADICTQATVPRTLLFISAGLFILAIMSGLKVINRAYNRRNEAAEIEAGADDDPVYQRYKAMLESPEIVNQYMAPEMHDFINVRIVTAEFETFMGAAPKKWKLKSNDEAINQIGREIYLSIVEGYTIWLAERLTQDGSLEPAHMPNIDEIIKAWSRHKFVPYVYLPRDRRRWIKFALNDPRRFNFQQANLKSLSPQVTKRLRQRSFQWLTIGINLAQFESTYRNDEAREAKHISVAEQENSYLELFTKLEEQACQLALAGNMAYALLLDGKFGNSEQPAFIAKEEDAAQVADCLQKLGFQLKRYKEPYLDFTTQDKLPIIGRVWFYTHDDKLNGYYFGNRDHVQFLHPGKVESRLISYKNREIRVVEPRFYMQQDAFRQTQDSDFASKTAAEQLHHYYYADADINSDQFQPIILEKPKADSTPAPHKD